MKKQFTIIKMGLIGLFLFPAFSLFAQVTDIDEFADFDTEYSTLPVQAVFCNELVTLQALEETTDAQFTSYEWYTVSEDGATETLISGQATSQLSYAPEQTGYLRFRVKGYNASGCFEVSDFVVYVLPEIQVTLDPGTSSLTYCEDQIPTGAETITLNATAASPNPNNDTFGYNITWLRNGVEITDADGTTTATGNAYIVGSFPGDGDLNNGNPNVYTVKVSYVINDGGCEKVVDVTDGININVTPAPGKPVITVSGSGYTRP